MLLKARRVPPRSGVKPLKHRLADLGDMVLYFLLIVVSATVLDTFQTLRTWITGEPREFPRGFWQFYLHWGLREDLGHFTNETIGYHRDRPTEASELDDVTAWVMAVIQFLWGYEELMGVVWDEWVSLRRLAQAAQKAGFGDDPRFYRLTRQWEVTRRYRAPLNGTYAEIRLADFKQFLQPLKRALFEEAEVVLDLTLSEEDKAKRASFQRQMSLFARLKPGRYMDRKIPIPLWDACIGLVINGQYHLINVVVHDENGTQVVYGQGGTTWPLQFHNGRPVTPEGDLLESHGGQLYRVKDGKWVGYLDIAPVSHVKWQIKQMLENAPQESSNPDQAVDLLLAETPRKSQAELRRLLSEETQESIRQLRRAPVIINWDEQRPRDRPLAQLRRAHRGIGDHALTIMRTESSILFDQSHIFFDGTWSLAVAEVLTTAAIQWCKRCSTITPGEITPVEPLHLEASDEFLKEAYAKRQPPEISAETTIWDAIPQISRLRKLLAERGMRLTVNDLLVITRIFHAAHYSPYAKVEEEIGALKEHARTPVEKRAAKAIDRSLDRGRFINPALYIPVDASPQEPHQRIYPDNFRILLEPRGKDKMMDNLVWVWDDTWEAYQRFRKFDPADTPDGIAAFKEFEKYRHTLLSSLANFAIILAANKAVAMRGQSMTIAVAKLLLHLPIWAQKFLNSFPEKFPAMNEVIKGDEVYSNVGRVAPGSSLTRFITAKDDGNTKALAWGVMTDDEDRLFVTMRDFRPHVKPLVQAGRIDLAHQMAQDYVVAYTSDLIGLVARLTAMLQVEMPGQYK